ncbi:MAG: RibD family protein, partial [Kiritimatiellae bacterium]|nr:RibD family protein [Kiritimatiellia bacterium]
KICDFNGDAKWISSADARRKTGLLRERVDAIMVGAHTVRMDNPSLLSHGEENPDLIRVVVSRSGDLPRNAQIFTDGKNKTLVFDDAKKALEELGKMGVTSVLCEGGFELASYLALEGLVDKWIAVLAPKVIGKKPIGEAVTLKDVVCLQDW